MGTRDIRVQVRALTVDDAVASEQVAGILVAGFAEHWPGSWPDLEAARAAVSGSLGAGSNRASASGGIAGWWSGRSPGSTASGVSRCAMSGGETSTRRFSHSPVRSFAGRPWAAQPRAEHTGRGSGISIKKGDSA